MTQESDHEPTLLDRVLSRFCLPRAEHDRVKRELAQTESERRGRAMAMAFLGPKDDDEEETRS